MFQLKPDATDAERGAISSGLAGLPAAIATIRAYHFGPDAGLGPDNWDFVVVADFDDEAGYVVYRDHPAHQAVIADAVKPAIAARAAVQYSFD